MTQPIGWENWPVAYIRCIADNVEIRQWMDTQTISDKFYEIHTPRWANTQRVSAAYNYRHVTGISYRVGDTKLLEFMILKWEVQVLPSYNEQPKMSNVEHVFDEWTDFDSYVSWDKLMEEDRKKERGS
jgi:hypothetical protein